MGTPRAGLEELSVPPVVSKPPVPPMSEPLVPPVSPRLTRGGAEGRLILQLAALRHLGVAGLILAGLRVWGGRAGGEGTRGWQGRLALLLAEPPAQAADEQCPGSSRQQKAEAVGEA